MRTLLLLSAGCATLVFGSLVCQAIEKAPYAEDADITALLEPLESGSSLVLPVVKVEAGGLEMYGMERIGPGQRDYCNKMAYASGRQTALYAGGNHQSPHRMNDVWEYHLGSNTWHLLYRPDGGNAGKHKSAYFLTSRTLVREPDKVLDEKEQGKIADYHTWWNEHVVFKDGHLTTSQGGPIMPAHTWDALCYDDRAGRLLWGMGANPAAQLSTLAYFSKKPIAELEAEVDPNYTPMWMFDPAQKKWIHYRTTGRHAQLRGMGATMTWLPDQDKSLWYVAAQNVLPAAFEMWLFDAVADQWTELKPNNGKSIDTLAGKEQIAPMSEVQSAYSPKHKKLVAVLKHDTFVYDVAANEWAKVCTDQRIFGHDAQSVFAYDPQADVFLLAFPPEGRGKAMKLAKFSLDTGNWEMVELAGPQIPETKFGGYMGYYDLQHNVFVIQGRNSNRMWVYRHSKE